jgi:energy-coupling factor transport system permease protein
MDSRGYGRSGDRSSAMNKLVGTLMVVGLAGILVGVYALLDGTAPRVMSSPMLVAGLIVGVGGVGLSGTRVRRTAYRPDHWRTAELVTAASGLLAAFVVVASSSVDAANLNPSLSPLVWPQLPLQPLLGVLIGLVPLVAAPPPLMVESPPDYARRAAT